MDRIGHFFAGVFWKILFPFFLVGHPAHVFSQQNMQEQSPDLPPDEQMLINEDELQQRIESLLEDREEVPDISQLMEELEVLKLQPLNLNTASAEELRRIFFLNDFQISNLIRHREVYGDLISLLELQTIEGFDMQTIRLLMSFVVVEEKVERRQITFSDVLDRGKSQFFLRYQNLFEQPVGYAPLDAAALDENPNARYLGSPFRLYSRYRFTYYNNISVGITAEKDPGEEFFRGTQKNGFDYYSAHLLLREVGRVKSLALGDYQVQFGQGVTLWSGLAFGKSSDAVNLKKNGLGLRQYTSVDENNFLRGGGASIEFGNITFTGFYSSKYRDANVLDMDTVLQEAITITSLQQTGLHRTPSELADKNSVRETYYGGNISYRKNNFQWGITGYAMELGADLQRNLSFYNQFDFNARQNQVLGTDYSWLFRNFNFFGEMARSQNGGYALLNGLMISLDPRFSMSILHRKFSKDYHSLLSASFSENTRVINESGLYLGATAKFSRAFSIQGYVDHFSFPWMKFRTYAPSRGFDYLLQVNYRPERDIEMYLRYRIKNKPLNSPDEGVIRSLDDVKRQNIRFHISYPVSESFTFKNRVEFIDFEHGSKKQQGFLIYQDIAYKNFSSPWAITARYALFDTDGFDSRIYAYENDVLYAFSFPFYADKGGRAYLVARYRLNRNVDLQARIARIFYSNRQQIGTGKDMTEGNARTELKAQLRIRF